MHKNRLDFKTKRFRFSKAGMGIKNLHFKKTLQVILVKMVLRLYFEKLCHV